MRYIFVDSLEEYLKVGIVEDDRLIEFHIEEKSKGYLAGNIYRGRVVNVLPGMEAAFVDIGESKNAYLYVKDALPKEFLYEKKKYRISEVVKSGEEIIVQVSKEPVGSKGPKVTTHVELPGRYLVFTPFSNRINISRKIQDIDEIQRLKEIGEEITRDGMGVIFRTAAGEIDKEKLKEEYDILYNIYGRIQKEKNFLPCPKLLYREPSLEYQIIRDSLKDDTEKVVINAKKTYDNLLLMEDNYPFKFSHKLQLDTNFSVTHNKILQADIKLALQRKVPLKSGGYIVIDETEALTAIDVNTGKFVGSLSLKDTVLKTNMEAAEEIARQIRLRDIGGIIIIDFIDMKNKEHIAIVLSHLKKYLSKDKIKTNIIDITKLGLVELTRKKIRRSLSSDLYEKCSKCDGKGYIINM